MSRSFRYRGTALTALAVLLAGVLSGGADAAEDDPVVRTSAGLVRGSADGRVVRFRGVPYAEPPTGARRWRPPAPALPWRGIRQATRSGPPCPQGSGSGTAEDCLHLDVTAPRAPARRGGRPVMVWLHGDGFQGGSAGEIDPARLAVRGDVVVVSVDFRLGVFGLFGVPGMPGAGTFTLRDQQAALRWVRANAGAFGGDARNVTLFGQSGGAVGACAQLTSPGAAGLFDKVVLQSGSCGVSWPKGGQGEKDPEAGSFYTPLGAVLRAGRRAAREWGCDRGGTSARMECLRALPAGKVLGLNDRFTAVATGTATLPSHPAAAVGAGRFHPVPVISGHTRDELRFLAGLMRRWEIPLTPGQYHDRLVLGFGDAGARRVEALYPPAAEGDSWVSLYTVYSDRMFVCPQIRTADALSRRVPVHSYEFADEHAPPYSPVPAGFDAGASHAAELLYLFDIKGKPVDFDGRPLAYTAAQRRLADQMIDYWAHFARTGRPGDARVRPWRRAAPGRTASPEIALAPGRGGIRPVDGAAEHHCGFWRSLPDA
ncbi:carboxylesterase/lipase family protein [Actinomadura terrae]|uniref:carboxylesterase/lipase family protein n=1 Tax=Actinomadura terrae TaxID=604353 RepID=UPI001FA7617D|nr:carboxylesterase family protein [Actinomadura terrae]